MIHTVYTIGHSNHTIEHLTELLSRHQVSALADVRSTPYSRFNPQFNRDALKASLKKFGIAYAFFGEELGARPRNRECYVGGTVQYDLLAGTTAFKKGIRDVAISAQKYRIALVCAERDPLTCHRAILVARHLAARSIEVQHILEDGTLESHSAATDRLLLESGFKDGDLFRNREEMITAAYAMRARQIAYSELAAPIRSAPDEALG